VAAVQYTEYIERNIHNNKTIGKCGLGHVFASYTLTFALQLRKKQGKTSVRVGEKCHVSTSHTTLHPRYIMLKHFATPQANPNRMLRPLLQLHTDPLEANCGELKS
jgi:hypothetical protein